MNGLLIGRFQPFHNGHVAALEYALTKVENLWLGIGSSNKPPQKNNPFSADERKEMIVTSLDKKTLTRIQIFYIPDFDDHEKWIANIDTVVPPYDVVFSTDELTRHLYSKRKIKIISIPFLKRDTLSGTNVRDMINSDQNWEKLVPKGTKTVLEKINAKGRLVSL